MKQSDLKRFGLTDVIRDAVHRMHCGDSPDHGYLTHDKIKCEGALDAGETRAIVKAVREYIRTHTPVSM